MRSEPTTLDETDDFPVKIEPGELPSGERILWQGKPDAWRLTLNAFRLKALTLYFGLLVLWRLGSVQHDSGSWALAFAKTTPLVIAFAVCVAILSILAWLYARSTGFTVTDRRIVMRFGVALPSQLNIPLKDVEAAGLRLYRDGTGDIPLTLPAAGRPFYFQIWPFARPLRFRAAEPMLRAVPDAETVAGILAKALATTGGAAVRDGGAQAPARQSLGQEAALA